MNRSPSDLTLTLNICGTSGMKPPRLPIRVKAEDVPWMLKALAGQKDRSDMTARDLGPDASGEFTAVKLALIRSALEAGGEGAALKTMLDIEGEPTATFSDKNGSVTVQVNKVHGWGPHYEGGTVIAFRAPVPFGKERLIVDEEVYRVTRAMNEAGWVERPDMHDAIGGPWV